MSRKIVDVHGSTIVKVVPCGVHPLHDVKVRASGARGGCPMCEIQIEDLTHQPAGEDLCRNLHRTTRRSA